MVARPIDAAEGYRVFRQHDGAIVLDEINEYLAGIGLRPVSPRMYLHYQRLARNGYDSYITINRFDIAVSSDHAWSEDMRARYAEVREPADALVIWEDQEYPVLVEGLGIATASIRGAVVPPAGANLVLRLEATGIERTGTVVRSDTSSKLFHVAFDPYTSLPVASEDAPCRARFVFPLEESAHSVVAVTDVMLKLDRLLTRSSQDNDQSELARLSRLSLNSPFEVLIVGGAAVSAAASLALTIAKIRREIYEGNKTKEEVEGVKLDNAHKRRAAQLEVDRQLAATLDQERDELSDTPLLNALETSAFPKGEFGSEQRQRFVDAAKIALDLPSTIEGETYEDPS